MWRVFSLDDEAGTVICTYPDRTPAIPIPYCEETMTGFEYALGALMIAEGHITEGEQIVRSVRDRYNGENRNPWNEIECSSNYARSMASFALLPIYSGFTYDMTKGYIGFKPISSEGEYLFSIATSYGTVKIEEKKIKLSLLGKPLSLRAFGTSGIPYSVKADGEDVDFVYSDGQLAFKEISVKDSLEITLV